jgi:transcriptional/translational regulatory protein YebC/TACO1
MAGHSKFKNIQFRKDRQDSLRSKLFSKLSRDITLAAKQGLPDPAANSRLRLAIANAKAESMPKDNIDRAIKKAQGGDADTYEEIRYEGFGPGGVGSVAFMFERVGEIVYPPGAGAEEAVLEAAIEAGAQDAESDAEGHVIRAAFEDVGAVIDALESSLGPAKSTAIVWRPRSGVPVGEAEAATLAKLIGALEDDDDVQSVWTNADIDDEVMARLAG